MNLLLFTGNEIVHHCDAPEALFLSSVIDYIVLQHTNIHLLRTQFDYAPFTIQIIRKIRIPCFSLLARKSHV